MIRNTGIHPASKTVSVINLVLPPAVLIMALFGLWQFLCVEYDIHAWLLAKPTDIAGVFVSGFQGMLSHLLVTYTNILIGFALAVLVGLVMAIMISSSRLVGSALTPIIVALCCIPMVTLVPMLMLVFGLGRDVKIITIVIQAFPLVNMNAAVAFMNVEPTRLELMQSLKASRCQQFRYCILPSSLPGIFTGVKLASIMAMIAGVSAEMAGGNTGLGNRISYLIQYSRTAEAMACIIYIAILGIVLYGGISLLERRLVKSIS